MAQGTLDVTGEQLQKRTDPSPNDRIFMINPDTREPQYIETEQIAGQVRGDMLPAFDLDNIRVMTSTAPDGKLVKSNVLNKITGKYITFKEVDQYYDGSTMNDDSLDGFIYVKISGKYLADAEFLEKREVDVLKFSTYSGIDFQSAFKFNSLRFPNGLFDIGSSDINIRSGQKLVGSGETVIKNLGSLRLMGEKSNTVSTILTHTASRSLYEIEVNSVSGLSIGDHIEITQPISYFENSTNRPASELNQIRDIVGNVITLYYPLAHNYITGLSDPPTVTLVSYLLENVTLDNIILDCGFRYQYCKNVTIRNVRFKKRSLGDGVNIGPSINMDIQIDYDNDGSSSPNACAYFYNIRNLTARVNLSNAQNDAIRLWGCSGVLINFSINNARMRAINIYNSNDIVSVKGKIEGDISQSGNTETILVNYGEDVTFYNTYINEIGKSGTVSYLEFRGKSKNVKFIKPIIHNRNFIMAVVKATATGSVIKGGTIYNHYTETGASCLVDLQSDTIDPGNTLFVEDNNVIAAAAGAGIILVRSATNSNFVGNPYELVKITGNTFDRGRGSIATLPGLITGEKIKKITVYNNTERNGDNLNGSLMSITRPTGEVVAYNNTMQDVGSRSIIVRNSDRVNTYNNRVRTYDITDCAIVRIDKEIDRISSGVNPTGSEFSTGDVVKFTSTNVQNASGYFLKTKDGYVRLGFEKKVRESSGAVLDLNNLYSYNILTGSAGNRTINANVFSEGDEIIGEIDGGAKTFIAGADVTLRYKGGFQPVIPANGRFSLKFKSANNVLLTGDLLPA